MQSELNEMKQALAACAYWAANGLHPETTSEKVRIEMLRNILKESRRYAVSEPDCDSNLVFEGFEYTYIPVGGWPEPEREWISGRES